jgi:hypothetical protein
MMKPPTHTQTRHKKGEVLGHHKKRTQLGIRSLKLFFPLLAGGIHSIQHHHIIN